MNGLVTVKVISQQGQQVSAEEKKVSWAGLGIVVLCLASSARWSCQRVVIFPCVLVPS